MKHEGYNSLVGTQSYKYKYNGKELQETGMYDYGARFYMPDIGRWGVQDLISEADTDFSPYAYVLNNPITSFDLFGFTDSGKCPPDCPEFVNGGKTKNIQEVVLTGKKGNATLDNIQLVLDGAGWIPGVQTVAGVANAGIDIYRGNYGSAALNLFTAIPLVGYVGKTGKLVNTGLKIANNVEKMKAVKYAIKTAKYSKWTKIKGYNVHHIIPKGLLNKGDDLADAIKNSGFDINSGDNLRYISDAIHGNHPQYSKVVAQKLTEIMEKNGGTLSAGEVQGVINQMQNFINNAEKAFDGTKATNLNNFSREFVK